MNQNTAKTVAAPDVAEIVVPCLDLDQTLSFFIENLGFRVEMITPADNPKMAIVSGYGLRLCLRSGGSGKDIFLRLHSTDRKAQTLQAPNGTTIEIINPSVGVELPELRE